MKRLLLLSAISISMFALITTGCQKVDKDVLPPDPPSQERSLAGTKWKLVKLTHTETKVERPIFIGDEVFTQFVPTMDFITDSTGYLVFYPYCHRKDWDPDFNDDNLLFNINKINPNYPMDYIEWFKTNLSVPDNIADFLRSMSMSLLGYKVEGTSLKLFCPDDGFFCYDYYTKEIIYMANQFGLCTDSNWYNCIVWEEVK